MITLVVIGTDCTCYVVDFPNIYILMNQSF